MCWYIIIVKKTTGKNYQTLIYYRFVITYISVTIFKNGMSEYKNKEFESFFLLLMIDLLFSGGKV